MHFASIAIMTAIAGFTAISTAADEKLVQLTQGPGLDKVEAHCSACHSLDYVPMNSPFLSAAGWDTEVAKMINAFGAQIDQADAKTIADYLKKNYGIERLDQNKARPAGAEISSPKKDKGVPKSSSSNFGISEEQHGMKRPERPQTVATPQAPNHTPFKRTSLENRNTSTCSAFQSCWGYEPLLLGVGF
jgi:sulfite dehydrogenase (cytochrome) subunit B